VRFYKRAIFVVLVPFIVIFICVAAIYWSLTDVGVNPSPTGDYSVKMYWTDVGGWGWKGKVYLVKHGLFDKKRWTGIYVPASSEWISEYEFELTYPNYNSGVETKKYNVYDFFNPTGPIANNKI